MGGNGAWPALFFNPIVGAYQTVHGAAPNRFSSYLLWPKQTNKREALNRMSATKFEYNDKVEAEITTTTTTKVEGTITFGGVSESEVFHKDPVTGVPVYSWVSNGKLKKVVEEPKLGSLIEVTDSFGYKLKWVRQPKGWKSVNSDGTLHECCPQKFSSFDPKRVRLLVAAATTLG